MTEEIYTYIYMSEVVNDISPKDFSHVINDSRSNNIAKNISGILFYDGTNFFQYIEGEYANLFEVICKIEASNKHQNIQVLYRGNVSSEARKFSGWKLGYVDCINHFSIFDTFNVFSNQKPENLLMADLFNIQQAMMPMIKSSDIQ